MPKLTALTPINHNGRDYGIGDTFDVSDKAQVEQLVQCGAAVASGQKTKAQAAAEVAEAASLAAAQADATAAAEAGADQGT